MSIPPPVAEPPLRLASSCPLAAAALPPLPADVEALVRDHPCYSEEAHRFLSRLHLAVAPACNIQCNYCNRKFDCVNESRPGVTAERLDPEQAVARAQAVAAEVPGLSVVGIAGPGDALASPVRTFATLEGVRKALPRVALCLSTNGLQLPEWADRIAGLGIRHVTVTVNMVDPAVGERIYAWVYRGGRRITGVEASRLLSAQQLEGIAALRARGVLVKVNSVVIPGVNDRHLAEVVKAVRRAGAFLVNLVPLISAPEHGTRFGLLGQRGPTAAELERVQREAEAHVRVMRHCRQCRADAVGRLGEERFAEFSVGRVAGLPRAESPAPVAGLERLGEARARAGREAVAARGQLAGLKTALTARVAVASRGGARVDEHFGHAREFQVYDVSAQGLRLVGVRSVTGACTGQELDEGAMARALAALADCRAVLVARVGPCALEELRAAGVEASAAWAFEPLERALAGWFAHHVGRPALASAAG